MYVVRVRCRKRLKRFSIKQEKEISTGLLKTCLKEALFELSAFKDVSLCRYTTQGFTGFMSSSLSLTRYRGSTRSAYARRR